MSAPRPRYRSHDEDSDRWSRFVTRPDDIVISTRSKHGTTWMQMICALLVLQTPDLPARLTALSPWVDWLAEPEDEVWARLAAQPHRRFVKTHTPLDGVPTWPGARYVVVGRHPLDAAVSLYHQGHNLDRERLAELTGSPAEQRDPAPPLEVWLRDWTRASADPRADLDSLDGVLRHLGDAWERRHDPQVTLVHYDHLRRDLAGEMRRLAHWLGIPVEADRWPELVEAASFAGMQARAGDLAPDPSDVFRSKDAFFREGTSGAGRGALTDADHAAYRDRVRRSAPAGLDAWLHGETEPGATL